MLEKDIQSVLEKLNNPSFDHPLFYHAIKHDRYALRFEIGDPTLIDQKEYLNNAFFRAKQIYEMVFEPVEKTQVLLKVDVYEDDQKEMMFLRSLFEKPQEISVTEKDGEKVIQLYWKLAATHVNMGCLLQAIIEADFGGYSNLVSNVYLIRLDTCMVYHLYDDRGLDVISETKESLKRMYQIYSNWLLDYDRDEMDQIFQK